MSRNRLFVLMLAFVAIAWAIRFAAMLLSNHPQQKAEAHVERGNYQEAAEIYQRLAAAESEPFKRLSYHHSLAHCWVQLERHEEAVAACATRLLIWSKCSPKTDVPSLPLTRWTCSPGCTSSAASHMSVSTTWTLLVTMMLVLGGLTRTFRIELSDSTSSRRNSTA